MIILYERSVLRLLDLAVRRDNALFLLLHSLRCLSGEFQWSLWTYLLFRLLRPIHIRMKQKMMQTVGSGPFSTCEHNQLYSRNKDKVSFLKII